MNNYVLSINTIFKVKKKKKKKKKINFFFINLKKL